MSITKRRNSGPELWNIGIMGFRLLVIPIQKKVSSRKEKAILNLSMIGFFS